MISHPALADVARPVLRALPTPLARAWLRLVLGDRQVALCLHRVAGDRDPDHGGADLLTTPATVLDTIVATARSVAPHRRWLTLTFDDGYPDAVDYVAERAPAHPEVTWRVFACPDKARRRAGFRWDAGLPPKEQLPSTIAELHAENDRPELRRAGEDPRTAPATVQELTALAKSVPDVLGNHTNSHLPLAALTALVAETELRASQQSFAEMFGPCRAFAFPFGTPGTYWRREHAEQLRAGGVEEVWSVQSRSFDDHDRFDSLALPRFPVDGRDSAGTVVGLVALRLTVERLCAVTRRRTTSVKAPATAVAVAVTPGTPPPGYVRHDRAVHLAGPCRTGSGAPPIVIVHGASGSVENFRPLAALAGRHRPVIGVRAPGIVAGEDAPTDIADLVSGVVAVVRRVGVPVRLAGYSLGGIIALAAASALAPSGRIDGPVVLLDSYALGVETQPMAARLRHARHFGARHGHSSLGPWARRLLSARLGGGRAGDAATLAALGFGDPAPLGLVDQEPHLRALLLDQEQHLPPYHGAVRWVRSLDMAPNLPPGAGLAPMLRGPVETVLARGDHFTMFLPEGAPVLAAALLR